jgi:RHS repeat-associated protein
METLCYFYHPDHLGSTSWVTDSAKNGVQYCEYLPYGEPFIDQRSTTWSSRYTFSGKERDSETGYSYFGARYYHSDLSIWLSVDPLSDKYPNLTPYAYCANNPVILVDPDGRWIPGLDEDNNVIVTAEEGDDLNSFKKFMGSGYNDDDIECMYNQIQGGTINLTDTYGGVFSEITNAINEGYTRNNPTDQESNDPNVFDYRNCTANYNCAGAALGLIVGKKLQGNGPGTGVGITSPEKFEYILSKLCVPVEKQNASVGNTLIRFSDKFNKNKHAAIFMGVDNSSNEYVFTKNGWITIPRIMKINTMLLENKDYGQIRGTNNGESGYYKAR